MLLPNQFIVLLMLVPIFVDSSPQPQVFGNRQRTGCTDNSQCGTDEYCTGLGSCAFNICSVSRCPAGTRCVPVQGGEAECQRIGGCTDHSQCGNAQYCNSFGSCVVNPCSLGSCEAGTKCQLVHGKAYCQRIEECNDDKHCGDDKRCVSNNCVDPCNLVQCREGSRCSVLQREPQCLCPSPTRQNSFYPCQPLQANVVGDRQNDLGGGVPQNGNQEGVLTSGTQGVSQAGVNEGGNQGGSNQAANHGGAAQGSKEEGVGMGDHQVQGGATQGGHKGGATQGGQKGGATQGGHEGGATQVGHQGDVTQGFSQGGTIQGNNQSGAALGGNKEEVLNAGPRVCTDNSQCRDNQLCELGQCASPCDLIECGQGAICNLLNENPQCICPVETSGNPFKQCLPIQESTGNVTNQASPVSERPAIVPSCTINSQCGSNERCQSGSCVDPCVSLKCGEGAVCQVSQRQSMCVCPVGTEGNPREQCKPKPGLHHDFCQQFDTDSCKVAAVREHCPEKCSGASSDIAFPDDSNQTQSVHFPGKGTRLRGCETKPDPGECRGAFPRYYYNKEKDQCDCFLYGGCDIEGVRFTWTTFDECLNKCVPENKTKGSGCKRATLDEVKEFLEEQRRNRESIRG